MIRSHFGLEGNPFSMRDKLKLLGHQKEVFDTVNVHCRQGGFCIIMGEPGTGKSVIKQALINHNPKKMITPSIARTLHTYSNTLQILCEAFDIDVKVQAWNSKKEKLLIEAAWKLNHEGKMVVPIIDDAHLMDMECLRMLRLLFEDFPNSHNLVLFAQIPLMQKLHLLVNEDIKSRITYSVKVDKLNPDDMKAFIFSQFDRVKLGHNAFSDEALDLIVRSAEGVLRRSRNLCISAMIEAVRDRKQVVGLDQVNRVLLQPHWRRDHDIPAAS